MHAFFLTSEAVSTGPFSGLHASVLWLITMAMLGAATFLFFFTIWMRIRMAVRSRKIEQYEQELLPLIFGFIEGEYGMNHLRSFLSDDKLKISVFENVIIRLLKSVSGDEASKLKVALSAEQLFSVRLKQLKSDLQDLKIQACLYFRHIDNKSDEVIELLKKEVIGGDKILSFSAASALMGGTDIRTKSYVLAEMAAKPEVSAMAMMEMFHRFREHAFGNAEQEADELMNILESDRTTDSHRATLIRCATEANLYYLASRFQKRLNRENAKWRNVEVLCALIDSQRAFLNVKAADMITAFLCHENPQIAAAAENALGELVSEELKAESGYILA